MTEEKIIDGRYKVFKSLSGGMGQVYFCHDLANNELPVAVKTIRQDVLSNQNIRSKFLTEANIWIRIGYHSNIVQAYNVQYLPEEHEIYIVSEFIAPPYGQPDPSLRSWLLYGNLNPKKALKFSYQIICGMDFATERIPDLVHRDLKPENILVGIDEVAKVHDFGIANSVFSEIPINCEVDNNSTLLRTHSAIGTLLYMSPEQCLAEPTDCRSDIYSFGLLFFEILTSKMAVYGESTNEVINKHLCGLPSQTVAHVIEDERTKDFLLKCVDKNKEFRFSNWGEVKKSFLSLFGPQVEIELNPSISKKHTNKPDYLQRITSNIAIGLSYIDVGELEKASNFFQAALEISRKKEIPELEAVVLSNLGLISIKKGSYNQALSFLLNAETIFSNICDLKNQAICLGNIGGIYQKIGQNDLSSTYFSKSLVLSRDLQIPSLCAAQLGNLAIYFMEKGEYEKASNLYQEAIELLQSCNAEVSLAENLSNFGNLLFSIGKKSLASNVFDKAIEIFNRHGLKSQKSNTLGNMANIYIADGDYSRAMLILDEAKTISIENGNKSDYCKQVASIATCFGYLGKRIEAVTYFEESLNLAQELSDKSSLGMTNLAYGNFLLSIGEFQKAISYFRKSVDYSKLVSDKKTEASAHGNLGKVYAANLNFTDAIPHLSLSIDIAKTLGLIDIEGRAFWTLGVINEIIGNAVEAETMMNTAVKIFREFNIPDYEQAALHLNEYRQSLKRQQTN